MQDFTDEFITSTGSAPTPIVTRLNFYFVSPVQVLRSPQAGAIISVDWHLQFDGCCALRLSCRLHGGSDDMEMFGLPRSCRPNGRSAPVGSRLHSIPR